MKRQAPLVLPLLTKCSILSDKSSHRYQITLLCNGYLRQTFLQCESSNLSNTNFIQIDPTDIATILAKLIGIESQFCLNFVVNHKSIPQILKHLSKKQPEKQHDQHIHPMVIFTNIPINSSDDYNNYNQFSKIKMFAQYKFKQGSNNKDNCKEYKCKNDKYGNENTFDFECGIIGIPKKWAHLKCNNEKVLHKFYTNTNVNINHSRVTPLEFFQNAFNESGQ